jgi:tryptophan-rich sensory protein
MTQDLIIFALGFTACLAAGSTGSLYPTGEWYKELRKPSWTPPDWVFPVAWLYLYLVLSYSLVRVYGADDNDLFLIFWALQIVFNTLWTPIFFGLHRLKLALLVLIGLWFSVVSLVICAFYIDWFTGIILAPYIAWGTYAGALNFSIIRLMPR